MEKGIDTRRTEIINVRLTKDEKRLFDQVLEELETTKSAFLRKKVKRILHTITIKL